VGAAGNGGAGTEGLITRGPLSASSNGVACGRGGDPVVASMVWSLMAAREMAVTIRPRPTTLSCPVTVVGTRGGGGVGSVGDNARDKEHCRSRWGWG